MRLRPLHLAIVAAFLAVSGYVHGKWSNRWSNAAAVPSKDLLSDLDGPIGDWQSGEMVTLNPADVPKNTQCQSRRFMPLKEGKQVVVSITAGSPGAVAVHTPDVCYLGAGYKMRGEVTKQTIALGDGGSASFWVGDFVKNSATGTESLRVRWAWTADGHWQAPDYPRWIFARAPVLYKLYIVHALAADDDLTGDDLYRKFVADLLPTLSRPLTN
jgi:hypothetical protein